MPKPDPMLLGEPRIGGEGAVAGRARRTLGARLVRLFGFALVLGLALAVGGFFWFASSVAKREIAIHGSADGIVALTGGTSRINDAIDLLATGKGKRLLITGVHKSASLKEIARLMPQYARFIDCCVDLDYSAVNTLGNAEETRRWAKTRGFRSLIVVTSNYHMPRSMAELRRQLPDVELTAFPVVGEKLREDSWWTDSGSIRLLVLEYLKFSLAQVRMRFEPPPAATGAVRDAARRSD